jgi:hypothetical protein
MIKLLVVDESPTASALIAAITFLNLYIAPVGREYEP